MTRDPYLTAVCRFCRRSRSLRLLQLRDDDSYECRDEVDCAAETQWAEGGDDGR